MVLLVKCRQYLGGGVADLDGGAGGAVLDGVENAVGGVLDPGGDEIRLFVEAAEHGAGGIVELEDDRFGPGADVVEQLAGGLFHPAGKAGAHRAQFGQQGIGGLVEPADDLSARRVEAAGHFVGGLVDGAGDRFRRGIEIADQFRPGLGDAVEIFAGDRLQSLGDEVAALLDVLGGIEAGPLDRGCDISGRRLQVIGQVVGGGLHHLGQFGHRLFHLVGRIHRGPLDGAADVLVDAGELVDALAHQLRDAGFGAHGHPAEVRRFGAERARRLRQLVDLAGELAREVAQVADHDASHALHLRGLGADFRASGRGASRHFVDGAGEPRGHVAHAGFEARQGFVGIAYNAVEGLGVGLKPGEQRIGVVVDDQAGLVQGGALVLDAGDQRADALLVAAEGALDRGDFLVDDFLQHGGALHGMLDAADQQIDFRTHRLGNGGQAFGGDILGADQAHGRLHQHFRHMAELGGAPQEIGNAGDHGDGQREQGEGPDSFGQVGGTENVAAGEQRTRIDEEPTHHPGQGDEEGDNDIGRGGWRPAQPGHHHRGARVVLVGGAATDRRGIEAHPRRFAPQAFGLGLALVLPPRFRRVACHFVIPHPHLHTTIAESCFRFAFQPRQFPAAQARHGEPDAGTASVTDIPAVWHNSASGVCHEPKARPGPRII